MGKCIRCGDYAGTRSVCMDCMDKWKDRRMSAFNQAIAEIGPLGPSTLKAIQVRVKQLEKADKQKGDV